MKLLLDECVDERLRLLFPAHDCHTARFANLAGLKNSRLLDAAEAGGFDGSHRFPIDSLSPSNRLTDLEPLVPSAPSALASIRPGQVLRIR